MAVPSPPINLTAVAESAQVVLTWEVPTSGSPFTDYIIEFSKDGNDWTTFNDGVNTNLTATVLPLENNQQFFFRVSAVNSEGRGNPSNLAVATPQNFSLVEYCTVNDIANRLRIDINANTQVNTGMVEDFILQSQERIDRRTGHSWRADRQMRNDEFDTVRIYDWGH